MIVMLGHLLTHLIAIAIVVASEGDLPDNELPRYSAGRHSESHPFAEPMHTVLIKVEDGDQESPDTQPVDRIISQPVTQ